MEIKKTKKMFCVLGVIFLIFSWKGILVYWPEFNEWLFIFCIMSYCTYRCFKAIIENERIKKIACLEWWIYTAFFYFVMNVNKIDTKAIGVVIVVLTTLIMFNARMFILYFRSNDWSKELLILFGGGTLLFVFAVGMVETGLLFWYFKVLTILLVFSAVKMVGHTSRFWGVVIMCGAYVVLVVLYGVLNSNFLLSSVIEGERNFYIAVQNLYALPEIEKLKSSKEIWENIVSFLMGRIMDAVLIGSLVNIFCENHLGWFEKRPCIKENELEKTAN